MKGTSLVVGMATGMQFAERRVYYNGFCCCGTLVSVPGFQQIYLRSTRVLDEHAQVSVYLAAGMFGLLTVIVTGTDLYIPRSIVPIHGYKPGSYFQIFG